MPTRSMLQRKQEEHFQIANVSVRMYRGIILVKLDRYGLSYDESQTVLLH